MKTEKTVIDIDIYYIVIDDRFLIIKKNKYLEKIFIENMFIENFYKIFFISRFLKVLKN